MTVYAGSCQCGNIRFEADTEIKEVISCNCSRCSRLGSLLSAVPRAKFRVVSDKGASVYKFNKHVINHVFCSTCGIQPYATGTGPGGVEMAMINVRCVEGVDPESFKVMKFDGRSM